MGEVSTLWTLLGQATDPAVAASLKSLVETGEDRALNRINPLVLAAERGHGEEAVVSTLIHAARLGLFDLSWNVLCRSCGGVLEAGGGLKTINRSEYFCAFCAMRNEPTLRSEEHT